MVTMVAGTRYIVVTMATNTTYIMVIMAAGKNLYHGHHGSNTLNIENIMFQNALFVIHSQ
jgi:hypothetical protein